MSDRLDKALVDELLNLWDGPFAKVDGPLWGTRCNSMLLAEATDHSGAEVYGWLRQLAADLTKGTTAEALALALVFGEELLVLHNRDMAEARRYLDELRARLVREVKAWDVFVRHVRYRQRFQDWAARKPKAPKGAALRRKPKADPALTLTAAQAGCLVLMQEDEERGDCTWFFDITLPNRLAARGLCAVFTAATGKQEGTPYVLTHLGRRALAQYERATR